MNGSFRIYKPGYPPTDGTLEELTDKIMGYQPDYDLITNSCSVNMVYKDYRLYMVRVLNPKKPHMPRVTIFYTLEMAKEFVMECKNKYKMFLIELAVSDWRNNLLDYRWYKHLNKSHTNKKNKLHSAYLRII